MQAQVLARTRQKLKELEARVDALEKARSGLRPWRWPSPTAAGWTASTRHRYMVEVHIASGLPSFTLVGLPDTEVKEARDRVRAAIVNSGFEFPAKRITVNLAPADLPKESGRFDLPIALGILAASGQIRRPKPWPITNLPANCRCPASYGRYAARSPWPCRRPATARPSSCPTASASEAALTGAGNILAASSLLEVCAHLAEQGSLLPAALLRSTAKNRLFSPTSPKCAARARPSGRWKLPRPAAIRC